MLTQLCSIRASKNLRVNRHDQWSDVSLTPLCSMLSPTDAYEELMAMQRLQHTLRDDGHS
jgi:hypothetical protein